MMHRDVYSGGAVKRAAWQFLTGKAASALLTFIILLWLVRLLPVADYGGYVVLMAAAELGYAMAALGLPWLAARYVPEYRLHASGQELARLCTRLMVWQAAALIFLVALAVLMLDVYLRWADLAGHRVAAGWALAMLIGEGMGRFLREGLMAPLMLQGASRVSLILRQLVFLAAIATLSVSGEVTLVAVLVAEVVAAGLGWLLAVVFIARLLRSLKGQAGEAGWQEPHVVEQWRVALRMHVAQLISLAYSPQVFINVIQRSLGAEAAALFGFLRTLFEQVTRYLPASLLFVVLRPKLMASYVQGGMQELAGLVNLAGKLSLFVLLPLLVLVALGGDSLVALLSGGKFPAGGDYLLGLLFALLPLSQRQLIETVAVAAGRAGLCTLGSMTGLLAFPLMLWLMDIGFGLWAPVVAMVFGQVAFNATVLAGLAPAGYRTDWQGALKLAVCAGLAWLAAQGALLVEGGVLRLLIACLLAALVFLGLAWRLQVFSQDEQRRLDGILGRQLLAR